MNDEYEPLWSDNAIHNAASYATHRVIGVGDNLYETCLLQLTKMRDDYEAHIAKLERGFNSDIPKIQSLAYSEGYSAGADEATRRIMPGR